MTARDLATLLRCPACGEPLRLEPDAARCSRHSFPVEQGIPRLLPEDLLALRAGAGDHGLRARTYRSFGFEWSRFSQQLDAYAENFRWYLEPLGDLALEGTRVLDAGCGMGRHTHHLLLRGATVVALDASAAVEVAARNLPQGPWLALQADVLQLPLAPGSFDLACCLGVLHHIQDTERGLAELVRAVRPGGWVLVYLYHDPAEQAAWRGWLLRLVGAARLATTRLPLPLVEGLAWLLACGLYALYVGPLKLLSRFGSETLRSLPLGQYIDYPFRVLWNDQFDRFSAPLEKRFRRADVERLLRDAGLESPRILGGYGWRAAGRRPSGQEPAP